MLVTLLAQLASLTFHILYAVVACAHNLRINNATELVFDVIVVPISRQQQ